MTDRELRDTRDRCRAFAGGLEPLRDTSAATVVQCIAAGGPDLVPDATARIERLSRGNALDSFVALCAAVGLATVLADMANGVQ